jgi:predicted phosphodiesterase
MAAPILPQPDRAEVAYHLNWGHGRHPGVGSDPARLLATHTSLHHNFDCWGHTHEPDDDTTPGVRFVANPAEPFEAARP